jgi:hypothetical protein
VEFHQNQNNNNNMTQYKNHQNIPQGIFECSFPTFNFEYYQPKHKTDLEPLNDFFSPLKFSEVPCEKSMTVTVPYNSLKTSNQVSSPFELNSIEEFEFSEIDTACEDPCQSPKSPTFEFSETIAETEELDFSSFGGQYPLSPTFELSETTASFDFNQNIQESDFESFQYSTLPASLHLNSHPKQE